MGRGAHCVLLALALALVLVPATQAQSNSTNTTTATRYPQGYVYIDCGESEKPVAGAGPNSYFSSNVTGTVSAYTITPNDTTTGNVSVKYTLLDDAERTLRAFPSGGCYSVKVAYKGTWSLRLGFAYYNFDKLNAFPNFTISFNGLLVDRVALADWEDPALVDPYGTSPNGGKVGVTHYTEYVQYVNGTQVDVCFEAEDGAPAIVNSLELVPYPTRLFDTVDSWLEDVSWTLSLKQRLRLGGPDLVPEDDPLLRRWHGERHRTTLYFEPSPGVLVPKYTNITDTGNETSPSWSTWPPQLFEAGLQGDSVNKSNPNAFKFLGIRMNYWPFFPPNHVIVRLLFKELNGNVTQPGQRAFNVTFAAYVENNTALWEGAWDPFDWSYNFDITGAVQKGFSRTGFPFDFVGCHPDPPYYRTSMSLFLFLTSYDSPLPPILSGLELYEVITGDDGIGYCPPTTFQPFFNQTVEESKNFPPISPDNNGQAPLSPGAIAGITIAAAVAAVLVVAAVALIVRRRRNRNLEEFQRFHSEGF